VPVGARLSWSTWRIFDVISVALPGFGGGSIVSVAAGGCRRHLAAADFALTLNFIVLAHAPKRAALQKTGVSQCVGDDRTDIAGLLLLRARPEVRLQHFTVERLR
jgi:hypothetical protein